jgi:hypothetical protein
MFTFKVFIDGVPLPVRRLSRNQLIAAVAVLALTYTAGGSIKVEIEYTAPVPVKDVIPGVETP